MTGALRLGTRRSALAMTQSTWVADQLRGRGLAVDLVEIVTTGDTSTAALTQIGGTGVFASAIRAALHENTIDFAVHSLKDLPSAPEPGLIVAAIPPREDPRDVLVSRDGSTLADLPHGAVMGTGSPRRAAQIRDRRPDLTIIPIRGNVGTRLARLDDGAYDATLLARAGLLRLGLADVATEVLPPAVVLPAPGQGALAVECRIDRPDIRELLEPLDDQATRACVTAERALLARLEAGCTAPIGALATVAGDGLALDAYLGVEGAGLRVNAEGSVNSSEILGETLAETLLRTQWERSRDVLRR